MRAAAPAPPTRAEWVDAQLRRAILHGELHPGEKLHAERLAELWGVSPTPVRETFNRLAGEGLVVIEPQRGARVASVSLDEAIEIYEIRLLLDPVALQRSMTAARGDVGYVAEVEHAHRVLTSRHQSLAALHDAHRAFHLALVSRCPNERLRAQVADLLQHAQRFHVTSMTASRRVDAADEHRQIVEAVAAGSTRAAVALLRRHLEASLESIRSTASTA